MIIRRCMTCNKFLGVKLEWKLFILTPTGIYWCFNFKEVFNRINHGICINCLGKLINKNRKNQSYYDQRSEIFFTWQRLLNKDR